MPKFCSARSTPGRKSSGRFTGSRTTAARASGVLLILDKLGKQGRASVLAELCAAGGVGLTPGHAASVVSLAETAGANAAVLDRVERDFGRNPKSADGVAKLRELLAVAKTAGIPDDRLRHVL